MAGNHLRIHGGDCSRLEPTLLFRVQIARADYNGFRDGFILMQGFGDEQHAADELAVTGTLPLTFRERSSR